MKDPAQRREDTGQLLANVGNLCSQWAFLEYCFSITIWHLLKLDKETGMIVTGGMDILPRVNMVLNLAQHLKADGKIVEAARVARRALQDDLINDRNKFVHGVFSSSKTIPGIDVEIHRGRGDRRRHPVTPDQVAATANRVHRVAFAYCDALEPLGLRFD